MDVWNEWQWCHKGQGGVSGNISTVPWNSTDLSESGLRLPLSVFCKL